MVKKAIEFKKTIMFCISLVILILLTITFWFTWNEFYNVDIYSPLYRRGNWLIIGIYSILVYCFTSLYGGYRIGYLRISEIIYSQTLSLIFINVITYLQIGLISRGFKHPSAMVLMTIIQIFIIIIWAYLGNKIYFTIYPAHKMVLVYGNQSAKRLLYKMSRRRDKYNICDTISSEKGIVQIFKKISSFETVVISDVDTSLRNKILKYCFGENKRVYLTPKLSDIIVGNADKIHLFDTPLLLCKNRGLTTEQRFFKRILDIVVSLFAIIITSPIMIFTAIAIKVSDGGAIFYKQERLSINSKPFYVYKFRSMVPDAEKDGIARLSTKDDERVTFVGKWIRKLRIDELPQFFNVFGGSMSVVGPRPERPELYEKYTEYMPEFNFRLKVKAGLTGYAQVLGKYNTRPYDKLMLDMMYIENYTIFLDLQLILMTIKILFIPESTEGIEQGTSTPDEGVK